MPHGESKKLMSRLFPYRNENSDRHESFPFCLKKQIEDYFFGRKKIATFLGKIHIKLWLMKKKIYKLSMIKAAQLRKLITDMYGE